MSPVSPVSNDGSHAQPPGALSASDALGGLDFRQLTTPRRVAEGHYEIEIADTWQQGRGAFGGLVLAILVRAIRSQEPDADRPLRSLTAALPGPVQPGRVQLRVDALRSGSGVSTLAAQLLQGGEVQAHAVAVLGRTRVTDRDRMLLSPPVLSPWRQVPVAPIRAPLAPVFTQHCEFRPTHGLPFAGQPGNPPTEGWVRLLDLGPTWEEADVVATIDIYWPALLVTEPVPRPMATIAFSLQLLHPPQQLCPSAPLYFRGQTLAARDGYVVEQRELWTEDGTLVAINEQTLVLVK